MKINFFIVMMFIAFNLRSQTEYIDRTYGVQGVSTIDFEGYYFFAYEFDLDSYGNAYLFNSHFDDLLDSFVYVPFNVKLDPTGELINGLSQKIEDIDETFGIKSFGFTWEDKNKILKYYSDVIDDDTVSVLSILDLEFNLEQSYQIDLPLFLYTGVGAKPQLDSKSRLIVNDNGLITRYLSDGSVDLNFGTNGELRVFSLENEVDRLWHSLYGSFLVDDNDQLIINGYKYNPNHGPDEPWYDAFIIKVDDEGQLVSEFGSDGRYENEEWEFYEYIALLENDEIFVKGIENDLSDTLCSVSRKFLMKLDANGDLETSFGDSGYYDDHVDNCDMRNFSFVNGPESKLAFVQETLINDTTYTYTYALGVLDDDGNLDSEFNDGQFLNLDFLPGTYVWDIKLDTDYNIFILSSDNNYLFADTISSNQVHVTKLDGRAVWDLPDYSSPFEDGSISIYPNPTFSNLIFNYDGPEVSDLTLIIYDDLGRRVLVDSEFLLRKGENYYNSLERFLVTGHYYVQLSTREGVILYGAPLMFISF